MPRLTNHENGAEQRRLEPEQTFQGRAGVITQSWPGVGGSHQSVFVNLCFEHYEVSWFMKYHGLWHETLGHKIQSQIVRRKREYVGYKKVNTYMYMAAYNNIITHNYQSIIFYYLHLLLNSWRETKTGQRCPFLHMVKRSKSLLLDSTVSDFFVRF